MLAGLALGGCDRNRNHSQGAQSPVDNSNPPAAATLAPAPAATLDQQPTAEPTQAPAEPTAVQPAADSSAINQATDDLSKALDGLTKDLDSTDTLNDVK